MATKGSKMHKVQEAATKVKAKTVTEVTKSIQSAAVEGQGNEVSQLTSGWSELTTTTHQLSHCYRRDPNGIASPGSPIGDNLSVIPKPPITFLDLAL